MVGHHIAQRACGIKVSPAQFHADRLRVRDLHMVDVTAIPDGLEDGVIEAEHHDVLHRLFAQVVIDAINLVFRQYRFNVPVQSLGRVEVVPKGFFNHDPPPASRVLVGQSRLPQLLHDGSKELRRRGQVEQIVALGAVFAVHAGQLGGESRISGWIGEFAALVIKPLGEPLKVFGAPVFGMQKTGDLIAKLVASQVVERDAHDGKSLGQQFGLDQVIKGRDELALGQVAGSAEQNHDARTRHLANLFVFLLPADCRCRRHWLLGFPILDLRLPAGGIVGQRG